MVSAGLVLGLLTGGFPQYAREIAQVFLIVVMTFSLTEVAFAGVSPRAELRGFVISAVLNYGVLSGLILVFAATSPDPSIQKGWVLMASVPPAIVVVPLAAVLKGNVRRSLISTALLYLAGLVLVPLITFAFAGQTVPIPALVLQTLLLIGLPIVLSRPLRRSPRVVAVRPTLVGASFFIVIFAVAGATRETLLGNAGVIPSLSVLSFIRTFGLGLAAYGLLRALRGSRDDRVAAATFSSFKNLSLTIVLAFSVFGEAATLPAIVALVFEVGWLAVLPPIVRALE